ncbi:hypothetical protein CHS0354_024798 [Potamilus streckersoni]|uniref:Uncharacterized protein n=1 Tax=Potamilus streckersoni TaxID=2493646 RepID=A0AAE0SZT8_9BIVA|nr:hypothetical protein CHS0354_024798 [Potamilus streckersoni]
MEKRPDELHECGTKTPCLYEKRKKKFMTWDQQDIRYSIFTIKSTEVDNWCFQVLKNRRIIDLNPCSSRSCFIGSVVGPFACLEYKDLGLADKRANDGTTSMFRSSREVARIAQDLPKGQ